jgi:fumarylacetoacetase
MGGQRELCRDPLSPEQSAVCVFSIGYDEPRCGVAIGDMILDVTALEDEYFAFAGWPVFASGMWNEFMELGSEIWAEFRSKLNEMLKEGSPHQKEIEAHLIPMADAELLMPFAVSEYTDFYAGRQHAANMGAILRGSPDLPATWLHLPSA